MATDPNKTNYVTDERTINTGTTLEVQFGTLVVARSVIITNKNTSNDISCTLNLSTNNSRVVQAGKSLILNDEYITGIWISNASGASVDFAVMIIGA